MTNKISLSEMELSTINAPKRVIVRISNPNPKNNNIPEIKKYDESCKCSDEEQSDREELVNLFNNLQSLYQKYQSLLDQKQPIKLIKDIVSDTEKKEFLSHQKQLEILIKQTKSELEKQEKLFIKKQGEIVPPHCPCWVKDEFSVEPESGITWDDKEKAGFYYSYGIKFFISEENENIYYYDKNGIRTDTASKYDDTFFLDPFGRKLTPCSWHGGLCARELAELKSDIMHYPIKNVNIDKYIRGSSPAAYAVYVYYKNGKHLDILCYDSCSEQNMQMRLTEEKLDDNDVIMVRKFINSVDADYKKLIEKSKEFFADGKKRDDNKRKLAVLKNQSNEIEKSTTSNVELNNLRENAENYRSEYENAVKRTEERWDNLVKSSKAVARSPIKREVNFKNIIDMKEPLEDDPEDVIELWNLIIDYKNSIDEGYSEDDLLDMKNEIIQKYKEVNKEELEKPTKKRESNISEKAHLDFIEANTSDYLTKYKTATRKLNKQEELVRNEKIDLERIKNEILQLEIEISQFNNSSEEKAKELYFQCNNFIMKSKRCLDVGKHSTFVYEDPDSIISEDESFDQMLTRTNETQDKFQKMFSVIEPYYNTINKELISIRAYLPGYSVEKLNAEFLAWKNRQDVFNKSRTQREEETKVGSETVVSKINVKTRTAEDALFSEEGEKEISTVSVTKIGNPTSLSAKRETGTESEAAPKTLRLSLTSVSRMKKPTTGTPTPESTEKPTEKPFEKPFSKRLSSEITRSIGKPKPNAPPPTPAFKPENLSNVSAFPELGSTITAPQIPISISSIPISQPSTPQRSTSQKSTIGKPPKNPKSNK